MPAPRYATLRDYVRVLRARAWLVALITCATAALAVAGSLATEDTYEAEAALAAREGSLDIGLVGGPAFGSASPAQIAAETARVVTSERVADRVRRELRVRREVEDQVAARVEADTNFVVVTASSRSPRFAARLANEFSRQTVKVVAWDERNRFREAARSLRRELGRVRGDDSAEAFQRTVIARLEAVGSFTRPVELARPAEPPSSPSSPDHGRNATLGLIGGLLLGLVAAFVRDGLDRRVRSTEDVEQVTPLPILARVERQTMRRLARGRHGGPVDLEPFQVLRANLDFLVDGGPARCVLVTSAAAREGKSTVAAALVRAAATVGKRALLVDADLRRGELASRLGTDAAPGLSEFLAGTVSRQEVVHSVREGAARNGRQPQNFAPAFEFIPSGTPSPHAARLTASAAMSDLLSDPAHDLVVVDGPPLLAVADGRQLAPHVDAILVCVRGGTTTRDQILALNAALAQLPHRPVGLVLTDLRPEDGETDSYYSPKSLSRA